MIRRHMFKLVGIALVLGAAACSGESSSDSGAGVEKSRMSTAKATTKTQKSLGITTWHTAWQPESKAILLDGADDKGKVKFSLIVRKDADGVGHVDSYRAAKGSLTIAPDGTQSGSLDVNKLKKYMDAMNSDWEKATSKENTEYALFLPIIGGAIGFVCANSGVCKDVIEGAWCKVADSTLCAEREQKYEEAKQKAQEARQKREQQSQSKDGEKADKDKDGDDEGDDKADEEKADEDKADEDKDDEDKDNEDADNQDGDENNDEAGEGDEDSGELTGDEVDNDLDENGGADDESYGDDDSSSDYDDSSSDDSSSDDSSSDDSSSDDSSSDDSGGGDEEYAAHKAPKVSKASKAKHCKKLSCSKSSKACMCRKY